MVSRSAAVLEAVSVHVFWKPWRILVLIRTGPMMVACQWNYCAVSAMAMVFYARSAGGRGRYGTKSDVPDHRR